MSIGRRDDHGLTLVELVFSVAILGFILAAVTAAITVVLVSASPTQGRVTLSHDKQIIDAFVGSDIRRSAPRLVTGGAQDYEVLPVTITKPSCIALPTSTLNTGLVGFTWQDSSGGSPTSNNYAWYYVAQPKLPNGAANTTKPAQLHRAVCSVSTDYRSADGTLTGTGDVRVAATVNFSAMPAHPVSCAPASACSAAATCNSVASCPPAAKSVALDLPLGLTDPVEIRVQGDRVVCLSPGECPRMTVAGT